MEQGLDRRARGVPLLEGVGEVLHHFLVVHLAPLLKGREVVHPDAGEVLPADAFKVGPAPLDPQNPDLTPPQIPLGDFEGTVPPSPDHQRTLGPDEPGAIHKEVEPIEPLRLIVRPTGAHSAFTIHRRLAGSKGQRLTATRAVTRMGTTDRPNTPDEEAPDGRAHDEVAAHPHPHL